MKWFEDTKAKERLAQSVERQKWASLRAMTQFAKLRPKLPAELQQESRIGPLVVDEMPGLDHELVCWMYPVDGSKFQGVLLGARNHVKLVDTAANILYDGLWNDIPLDLIQSHTEFYVWVKPLERKNPTVFRVN